MATQDDIRQIASRLPGVVEGAGQFGFSVVVKGKAKGILWSWLERVHPKKARVANDAVIAIVVPNLSAKDLLIGENPDRFVHDPHYDGYPAVIVRMEDWSAEELEDLIIEAWRSKASKELREEYDAR